MLILSGLRRTECAAIQKAWVKDDLLHISADVTKNGLEHILPLGPLANALIAKALKGSNELPTSLPHLFPGKKLGRPFSGWSKAKKSLDKVCGVKAWRLH